MKHALNAPAPHLAGPLSGFTPALPDTPPPGGPWKTHYIKPPFTLNPQQQSNWCWLATASDVHAYYHPGEVVTQCALAGQVLSGQLQCCTSPTPAACNQPGLPSVALQQLGNFGGHPSNSLSYPEVKTQINLNSPIIIGYVEPNQNVGHAVLVLGYAESKGQPSQVYVGDPQRGYLWVEFSKLLFTYGLYQSDVCFTRP